MTAHATASLLTITVWLACGLADPAVARAQQPSLRIDVSRLGPQRGEIVPDFRLPDAQGKVWTRADLMGTKGAMVVFSRSLDWCPYCKTQVVELQSRVAQLRAQGLGLAVITYDAPEVLADFARRRGITFPLLSDAGSPTIKAYGILNTTVAAGSTNYGIPFPGTFLIDRSGKVTSRFFEEAYQERNTVSAILLALGAEGATIAGQRVETDHLTLTSHLSDDVVAPGSLFSLVVDVTPKRGIHVYAPGATSYRVIGVTLDPNPLLQVRPVQYPASELYHFKPLNERVPVYLKPFRLVGALALATSAEARAALGRVESVTVSGKVEYQACDDRVCFTPRTIPVSHVVKVRQLDTERSGARRR